MSDTVTITRAEYDALVLDAGCWRLLVSSPHLDNLLVEWREWAERQALSESTAEIAAMFDWRKRASAPTYAELARRRTTYATPALTSSQIRQRAAASWAAVERRCVA